MQKPAASRASKGDQQNRQLLSGALSTTSRLNINILAPACRGGWGVEVASADGSSRRVVNAAPASEIGHKLRRLRRRRQHCYVLRVIKVSQ